MGTRTAKRSQMLVALRRWMPNASLRRIGDLLDQAKVITELVMEHAVHGILNYIYRHVGDDSNDESKYYLGRL